MSNNTGDRITHRGIEVAYVAIRDLNNQDFVGCLRCPFVDKKDNACETALCDGGYLLTVPDYVTRRLTK